MRTTISSSLGRIVLFLVLLLFVVSCSRPKEKIGPENQTDALVNISSVDWDSLGDPYAGEQVAAFLDSVPVTAEELERFRIRILDRAGSKHGQENEVSPLFALPAFRRYFAVIREARRLGLTDNPTFRNRFDLAVTAASAIPFQRWLEENTPIDADDLVKKIPGQWVQINFGIHNFSTEQKAKTAAAQIQTPEEFNKIQGDMELVGAEKPETGLIFPGSGFFEKWDDLELFKLSEGQVYGPVKTGIGWGVILVKERKEFDEEDQNAYMAKQRKELARKVTGKAFKDFFDKRSIKVDEDAFSRAVQREFTLGGYSDDVIVTIDGTEMSYRTFRLMKPVNYKFVREGFPMAMWTRPVRGDLMGVVQQVVMGMMATEYVREGKWSGDVSADIGKTLYDYRKTFLYYEYLDRLKSEVDQSVSDQELRDFFDSNRTLFVKPARADIVYIFTKDSKRADVFREKLKNSSFNEAAGAFAKTISPHSGTLKDAVKKATVFEGDKLFLGLQDRLFTMDQGGSAVLEGDMGFYLVRIDSLQPRRRYSFNEIKEQVKARLIRGRLGQHVNKAIGDLAAPVKVAITPEFEGEIPRSSEPEIPEPAPDLPHPDLG